MRAGERPLADMPGAIITIQVGLVIVALAAWEIMAARGVLNPLFFGRPSIIGAYLLGGLVDGSLIWSAEVTLTETLLGFVLGLGAGMAIATVFWWIPPVGRVFEQFLIVANAIPKVTLAPILIVLLGLGLAMKVALAFLNVVVFAALVGYLGMKQADPDLIDLVRAIGGSRWHVFRHVVGPASFSALVASMRIGVSLSFIGAVVGEFLAAREGLGYLAAYGAEIFNMSLVLVAVVCLIALALLLFAAIRRIEMWLLGLRPHASR